jgi:hypothetical protein
MTQIRTDAAGIGMLALGCAVPYATAPINMAQGRDTISLGSAARSACQSKGGMVNSAFIVTGSVICIDATPPMLFY